MLTTRMKFSTLIVALAGLVSVVQAAPVEIKEWINDMISSCGKEWMSIEDIKTNNHTIERIGFDSAVDWFCSKAAGQNVEQGEYLSMATRVWLDFGYDPYNNGINGYVYFEIHNKKLSAGHVVLADKCKELLKRLSYWESKCYGKINNDTKGGTVWVGNDDVTYHALGSKIPPPEWIADTTVTNFYKARELNDIYDYGNTLFPFPNYAFGDITPVSCHSHNDYTRDVALYSALSAGCISVGVDAYVHGDKLIIGQHDLGSYGPTLEHLYLDPLKNLIDERGAVFPAHPDQPFFLLINFKSDDDASWDALVKNLAPLRNAGYLSYYDDASQTFRLGKITIIASGNARHGLSSATPYPLPKVLSNTTNPGRAVFVDAALDKDMAYFNASTAYYASANFADANPGSKVPISAEGLEKMKEAKSKGFKVIFWDIPPKDKWQTLVDQGVDILSVDDLQHVAGVDWHL